ncbi:MAG: HD domain-containing phosphohydrolase [Spirochaetota bacterium]
MSYQTVPDKQQKILLVDDEPLVRNTLSKYLERMGYLIDTAEDGGVAIVKLGTSVFDLVLTDLKMPNVDGRELLQYMAEKFPDTPKIVLTGFGEEKDIIIALKAGANDFLFKPIGDFGILNHSVQKALEIKKLHDEKDRYFEQVKQINEIISLLNKGKTVEEIFRYLSVSLRRVIPFNKISLVQIDKINSTIVTKLTNLDGEKVKHEGPVIPVNIQRLEKDTVFRNKLIINNLNEYVFADEELERTFSGLIKLLKEEKIESMLVLPLIVNDEIKGFLNLFSKIPGFFRNEHVTLMESMAGHIALSIQRAGLLDDLEIHTKKLEHLVELRTNEILKTQRTTLFALSKLAEVRDRETGEHLERIRRYSILTAQIYKYTNNKYNITNIFLRDLYDSSILHDIGKVGIPDAILRKDGPLTREEFEVIKTHIYVGYNALKTASKELGENSFLKMAMDIILYHHERWDGTGYPEGLKGEEIPLAARIVTISDIYDALVSKRPYKDALSHEAAMEIMKAQESFFDPDLFKIFIENALEYDLIRKHFIDR